MRTDYLVGFLQWLEREHDISIFREEIEHYVDGGPYVHNLDTDEQLKLAKEYRHHVINTGEI